jgi:hypothetical protein
VSILNAIKEGFYLDKLLAALGWWFGLRYILTYIPHITSECAVALNGSAAASEEWDIESRRKETMRLYDITSESRILIDSEGPDPSGLELVKRYAELTELIRTLAQRDFPEANWNQLREAA